MDHDKITQLKQELRYFTGSESVFEYALLPNYCYTQGVQYLAEQAKAYWLIGAIISYQYHPKINRESFQVWTLEIKEDRSATLTVENGNDHLIEAFPIHFTDFPFDRFTLWLVDNILLLPSEY